MRLFFALPRSDRTRERPSPLPTTPAPCSLYVLIIICARSARDQAAHRAALRLFEACHQTMARTVSSSCASLGISRSESRSSSRLSTRRHRAAMLCSGGLAMRPNCSISRPTWRPRRHGRPNIACLMRGWRRPSSRAAPKVPHHWPVPLSQLCHRPLTMIALPGAFQRARFSRACLQSDSRQAGR